MLPKTIEETKQFIIWCKNQKIQQVKITENQIDVVFSPLALVDVADSPESSSKQQKESTNEEYERETLFWSTN